MMRGFGRFRLAGRVLAALVAIGATLWWFGPYEPVALSARFDPGRFDDGVQVYFKAAEADVPGITPGTEKRVIWAGEPETRTPISVLYVHGFSATSEEIRPVPDRGGGALGANLVYTRLAGHGRNGAPLLTFPGARYWLPLVVGSEMAFEPVSDAHARFWTLRYPTTALMPLAALVKAMAGLDFSAATVPALFRISDADTVVRLDIIREIVAQWGGPTALQVVEIGSGSDPNGHVIAGDIRSSGQTQAAVDDMLGWLEKVL